ncbi:hypothetical protein MIMGU_mgv1a026071mg, partial [Erythranthe guttata]
MPSSSLSSSPSFIICSSNGERRSVTPPSFIYLLGFFGIGFVQSLIVPRSSDEEDLMDEDEINDYDRLMLKEDTRAVPYAAAAPQFDDFKSVVEGKTPSYALESKLGDCRCAPAIRRESLQHITGKSLTGLVVKGFNYEAILGQCCEMPVGYVQILVGIAGPLLLDGREYSVPMATTEGCLVASTIRGCKAIYAIIKEEIVKKNLTGSAMAGALGAVVTMGRLILGFFLSDGARR